MSTLEIIFISVGLAMDAFAVAICKGLSVKKFNIKRGIIVGLYFGLFQGLMPLIGYFIGSKAKDIISSIDHWIIFVILGIIGINMILEAFKDEKNIDDSVDFKAMIGLSFATSIDALSVGITFAFLNVPILRATSIIGIITFVNEEQSAKASLPINVRLLGIVILVKEEQCSKAESPISVTPSGISTLVNDLL